MSEQADVVDLNVNAEAIEELSWYFGQADAAMRITGIDYRALAGGGGSHVEDDQVHVRRILAPMKLPFRKGLWKRAWIELALGALDPGEVRTLLLTFTPRRWQLVDDTRSAEDGKRSELSNVEQLIRSHLMFGRPREREGGICLLAVALECGVVREVYGMQPAVIAARKDDPAFEQPTRRDLLEFLEKIAERTAVRDNKKVSDAAEATFTAIRELAGTLVLPSIHAYHQAALDRDPERSPRRILERERDRRTDARMRELQRHPGDDALLASLSDLQGAAWR